MVLGSKKSIRINIIPLYRINIDDPLYLFQDKINTGYTLDLSWLDQALKSLSFKYNIVQIDLTGGEISLLSDFYFELLYILCKSYSKKVNVWTNLLNIKKSMFNHCESFNVKLNFNEYFNKQTLYNCKIASETDKIINVKSFDISCTNNIGYIIKALNDAKIKSWEVIPFFKSNYNKIDFREYTSSESTIKAILKYSEEMKFAFQNKLQLDGILPIDNYNIQTAYILPENKFGFYDFKDNICYIKTVDNSLDYINKLEELEKKRDIFCKKCTSKIMCLANYHVNTNYNGNSCSGLKQLIRDYRELKK